MHISPGAVLVWICRLRYYGLEEVDWETHNSTSSLKIIEALIAVSAYWSMLRFIQPYLEDSDSKAYSLR